MSTANARHYGEHVLDQCWASVKDVVKFLLITGNKTVLSQITAH